MKFHTKQRGPKFDSALEITEIAKRVRGSVKAMQRAGLFADMKVSVRVRRSAGPSDALEVTITKWTGPIHNPDWARADDSGRTTMDRYVARASKALKVLKVLGGAWNYNNSDSLTDYCDVNYFLDVRFEGGMHEADYLAARGETD